MKQIVGAKSMKQKGPFFTLFEIRIIELICREKTIKEIAAELSTEKKSYSHRTLEGYRNRIQEKMGAKSILGIVYYAIRHGIIEVTKTGIIIRPLFSDSSNTGTDI